MRNFTHHGPNSQEGGDDVYPQIVHLHIPDAKVNFCRLVGQQNDLGILQENEPARKKSLDD